MKSKTNAFTMFLPSFFHELAAANYIIYQLVRVELIARYRRTMVGFGWTLLNPLFIIAVLATVFSALLQVPLKSFVLFLVSGMIPWLMFSNTVGKSINAFVSHEAILKKVYINKALLPLSSCLASLVDALVSFPVFFLLILAFGGPLSISLLFLPFAFLLLFVFCLGIGTVISIYGTFFRDLTQIIPILLQGMFFLTPILYRPDSLVSHVKILVDLNPMTPYVELFRDPLLYGSIPSFSALISALILSAASIIIALIVYYKKQNEITVSL
jgi:ABC-type polysaccharide/polyol phosphate export permease